MGESGPSRPDPVGSLDWLARTGGRVSWPDRLTLLGGSVTALGEGWRLRRRARAGERRAVDLTHFEPPDTAIVRAAQDHVHRHCHPSMVNHSYRAGFWTLVVLHQHGPLSDEAIETAWVAALLHDVGLDVPPATGDFSMGGVLALRELAAEHGWSEARTRSAGEAIAANLCTRVDAQRLGTLAWAMNVGGLGELGFGLHRAQMHPEHIADLEARYPRAGFRETALQLIAAEARRLPSGRFALLRPAFWVIMRD